MVKNIPTIERSTKIRFGKNTTDNQADNTIVFNASNVEFDVTTPGGVYISPVRVKDDLTNPNMTMLAYNSVTKEITDSGVPARDKFGTSLDNAVNAGNATSNTILLTNEDIGLVANGNIVANYFVGDGSQLTGIVTDLQSVTNNGNTTSNTIQFTNSTTSLIASSNVVIDGNLTVNGALSKIDTVNTTIKDAIVELGKGNTSSDLGLIMDRPDSNVTVGFREGTDELIMAYTDSSALGSTIIPLTTKDLDVHVYGNVEAKYFTGDASLLSNIASTLQSVTDNGNTTSNTIQFTNNTVSLTTTGNVTVGSNISNSLFEVVSRVEITPEFRQSGQTIQTTSSSENMGWSVSISGDGTRAVVGAPYSGASNTGHVAVYDSGGSRWTQVGSDIVGQSTDAYLGKSVAISYDGSRIAIGNDTNNKVMIYELVNSVWTQLGNDITGTGGFGYAVALSSDGSYVVVGTDGGDYVEVYEWSGSNWSKLGSTMSWGSNPNGFGNAVDISSDGSRIVIGIPEEGSGLGRLRVYDYNGSQWQLILDAFANTISGQVDSYQYYSTSVGISADGSRIIVSAAASNNVQSFVHVLEYDGSNWSQVGNTLYGDTTNGQFGHSAAISSDGSRIVVGAYNTGRGYVQIYELDNNQWNQIGADLVGVSPEDEYGWDVDISGDGTRVIVGIPGTSSSFADGAVKLYKYVTTDEAVFLGVDGVNQRVGIMTDNPTYTLDVNGNSRVDSIHVANTDVGVVATGNVEANYFIGDGSQLSNVATTLQAITDNGNTTSNTVQFTNADVGIVATGNVEANYFIGDGSQLTGIVTDLQSVTNNGNTTSNTVQFTNTDVGIVATGNVEANYFIGDGSQLSNVATTLQAITDNGNTTSNTVQFTNTDVGIVATGNVEANYFIGDGIYIPGSDTTISSIATYNSASVEWGTRIGGTSNDYGYGISTDSGGNTYMTGYYRSSPLTLYNADGTPFGTTLPNSGYDDSFVAKYNASGVVQWAARIAGTNYDYGRAISVDNGNVYVVGYYSSTSLTLYNADGTPFGTTLPNSGYADSFVAKYNASGVVQWAARIAGTNSDFGFSISVDSGGNVYVVGYYRSSSLTLYNADGTAFGTTLSNSGLDDAFIAKYNTSGVVQWATRIGGTYYDSSRGSVDNGGNIYVVGYYESTSLTLYNAGGTVVGTTLSNSGSYGYDAFIAKYNTSGVVQWATKIAGTGNDYGNGISTDSGGNVYVTGYYDSNPLTLYNIDGTAFGTTLPNLGSNDSFVAKYNASGVVQWAARITGTSSDYVNHLHLDSGGNVYVVGYYRSSSLTLYNADGTAFGTTLSNSGTNDAYIAKYNTSGVVQWATRIAGTDSEIGYGISVDSGGNVYVSGYHNNTTLTLYNSDGTAFGTTLPNLGSNDAFIAKYATTVAGNYTAIDSVNNLVINTSVEIDSITTTNSDVGIVATGNVEANYFIGDGSQLTGLVTDLESVANNGNTTSNTIQFTNPTTAFTTNLTSNVGLKLEQLANVNITTPQTDHLLVYDGSDWVNEYNIHNFIKVHNTTGSTLYKGNVVYIVDSFNNNVANVALAKSDSSSTMPAIGLIHEDVLPGQEGSAVAYGKVQGIDTTGFTEGQTVYVSNTSAGNIMNTKPYGLTDQIQNVGVCIRVDQNNGVVFVTGVGRSNDIPNAPIVADESDLNYVYVNDQNNDLKKIEPSNLLTQLQTLQQVTDTSNTTSNTVQLTNADVGLVATGNVEANYFVADGIYIPVSDTTVSTKTVNSDVSVEWATRIAGTGNDEGRAISVDNGNVYVVGYYNSTLLTLYNADSTTFGTLTRSGSSDTVIAKYNTSGVVQWATRIAGTGNDVGYDISTDSGGNVYVVGYYNSTSLTLYNAGGTVVGTTLTNSGSSTYDVFIAKYNTSGVVQWATSIAGTSSEYGYGISTDSGGNVYVTGMYASTTLTLYNTGGSSGTTLTNSAGNDVFIAKYNTSGVVQWATKIAGAGSDVGYGISTDSGGNVYVTGYYNNTTVTLYNEDGTTFGTLTNSGNNDMFIAKYDTSGVVQWATRIAGTGSVAGYNMSTDSDGNVYVIGYYTNTTLTLYNADGSTSGTTLTNSGSNDVLIAKYNTSGVVQWATRIAGTDSEIGYGISVDSGGNVYVSGYYNNTTLTLYNADGSSSGTLTNSGNYDVFTAKYNTDGVLHWATKIAGTNSEIGFGISVDNDENVYVTGRYAGTSLTLYNSDGSTSGTTLTNSGSNDMFIAKYASIYEYYTAIDSSNVLVINTNVGIGTTNPDAKLHVSGNAYVSSNLKIDGGLFSTSGNVGINTSSPLETLDVYGGFLTRPQRTSVSYTDTWPNSTNTSFTSSTPYTGPTITVEYSKNASYTLTDGLKVSPPNSDLEAYYQVVSSPFGIRYYMNYPYLATITSPYLSGDVFSSTRFKADNTEDFTGFAIGQDYEAGNQRSDYSQSLDIAREHSAHMYFKTASLDGSLTEKMRITNTGNVGIGTTNPDAKLHVTGNVYASSNIEANYFIGDGSQLQGLSSTLEDVVTNSNITSNTVQFTNTDVGIVATGNVHANNFIGNVTVTESLIVNTGSVTKKFYSYEGTIPDQTPTTSSNVSLTFTSNIFYAKVVAHLVEDETEFSNMSLEVGGGSRTGGTTPNLKLGSVSVFGNASTNPWDSAVDVSTYAGSLEITPSATINNGDTPGTKPEALYNIFVEYITPDHVNGRLSSISLGGTTVKTFNY